MELQYLLYPAFTLVLLTVFITVRLGIRRLQIVNARQVDYKYYLLRAVANEEPEDVRKLNNHFNNLLELPILFYIGIIFALQFGVVDIISVSLAWTFVAVRFIHCGIHLTINHLFYRFLAFAMGLLSLAAFWIYLFLAVYFSH